MFSICPHNLPISQGWGALCFDQAACSLSTGFMHYADLALIRGRRRLLPIIRRRTQNPGGGLSIAMVVPGEGGRPGRKDNLPPPEPAASQRASATVTGIITVKAEAECTPGTPHTCPNSLIKSRVCITDVLG